MFIIFNLLPGAMICASLPERTAKQCRERYHNHLASDIKKTDWSNDEDLCVIILQRFFGNQWAKVFSFDERNIPAI